jgi:hypothetical protein
MAIAQDNSAAYTASGTVNVTLPVAPSASSLVVVTIAGNVVINTPSGWTLRASQVNDMGHYMWTRPGDGTTSSWAFTITGQGVWYVAEVENGSYVSASGQNAVSPATTYTTTALTPSAGERVLIASIGSLSNSGVRTVSNWLNSYTEESDACQNSSDRPMQGTASLPVTASGSTAYSTGATYSANNGSRSALHGAFGTSSAGGAVELEPDDSTHGHTSGSPTLAQVHILEPADSTHEHSSTEPGLSQAHVLQPQNSLHEHGSSSPTFAQAHVLEPEDSTHEHSSDPPGVTQLHTLEPDDSGHEHSSTGPTFAQVHVLAAEGSLHAHSSTSPTFSIDGSLLPDSSVHQHASTSPTFAQVHILEPEDSTHEHSSTSPVLNTGYFLEPEDSTHECGSTSPALAQVHILEPEDSTHEHSSPSPTLAQVHVLQPQDAPHGHTSSSPSITFGQLYVPPSRITRVPFQDRTTRVPFQDRTTRVPVLDRTSRVPA